MLASVIRFLKAVRRGATYLLPFAIIAGGWWGWWFYQKLVRERPMGAISGLDWVYHHGTSNPTLCGYTAPGGTPYQVNTSAASYRLAMRPEDSHARLVFPTYATALRYAQEHRLPSIPSTPLVLATCAAADTRFQVALELALDTHPEFGRRALLHQWLTAILEHRAQAPAATRPAYDLAAIYLATAIRLRGDSPSLPPDLTIPQAPPPANDPPLGPWAGNPELAPIWRRDRFLAHGIEVTDDTAAAAVAVLARTQPGGWTRQAAVARVLHGKPTEPTFEALAAALATRPNNQADGTTVAIVRRMADGHRPAPAALAFAASPEQEILEPLGKLAWNDPVGGLIAAVRDGAAAHEPGPDAGFYRHRWFAIESLAAPSRAPESPKLQLSTDYQRRWQRAFAAGFTEGRSGFIKRLPVITMGGTPEGKIALDIAPRFTAEPSPIVYLRLARAYRMLATGLTDALGPSTADLTETTRIPLVDDLGRHADRLLGLAAIVYREVGHPAPLTADESKTCLEAAEQAARDWIGNIENDPGVAGDARLLVTLGDNGAGSVRCPAVLGVRLEPVEYAWVEEPTVSYEIEPTFVPARLWLASPIPATVTVTSIPTPADFRKQCDAHTDVAALCRSFGQTPPAILTDNTRRWRWLVGTLFLLGCGWAVARWWRGRTWRSRLLALTAALTAGAGFLAIAWFHPPAWLVRWTLVRISYSPPVIAAGSERMINRWTAQWTESKSRAVFFSLIRDPDPQVRYCAAMVALLSDRSSGLHGFTGDELATLRLAVNDCVPEVGLSAWDLLAARPVELQFLLDELPRSTTGCNARMRLGTLTRRYPHAPQVTAVTLQFTRHPDPEVRIAALCNLVIWRKPATTDEIALRRLLELCDDHAEGVRTEAVRLLWSKCSDSAPSAPHLTDAPIQQAIIRAASRPDASFKERVRASRWIADPATYREFARRLLPEAAGLPEPSGDDYVAFSRRRIQSLLVTRWLLAETCAEPTAASRSETNLHLDKHPDLLARLVSCVAENPDSAAAVAIVRETATISGRGRRFAADLLERIKPPTASQSNP